jgi:predicted nucleotidyltransferase
VRLITSGACRFFGSRARVAARLDSDIDLLVEFEPGAEPGLLGFASLEIEFSQLLGAHRVDLRTPGDLSPHFRNEVLRNAIPQYAA